MRPRFLAACASARASDTFAAHQRQYRVLDFINVLIFIHQNVLKLLVKKPRNRGWNQFDRWPIRQQLQRLALQIGKIQRPRRPLLFVIARGKFADRGDERLNVLLN